MHDRIIKEMKNLGWNMSLIASRTGINQSRLEDGNLGVREQRQLARVAEQEAGVNIDELEDDE
jgi:hypothetical protein